MVSSNVAGFTKKAVTSAMVFIAYCAGNIIGPFLFFPSEAPGYSVSSNFVVVSRLNTNTCDTERIPRDNYLFRARSPVDNLAPSGDDEGERTT